MIAEQMETLASYDITHVFAVPWLFNFAEIINQLKTKPQLVILKPCDWYLNLTGNETTNNVKVTATNTYNMLGLQWRIYNVYNRHITESVVPYDDGAITVTLQSQGLFNKMSKALEIKIRN